MKSVCRSWNRLQVLEPPAGPGTRLWPYHNPLLRSEHRSAPRTRAIRTPGTRLQCTQCADPHRASQCKTVHHSASQCITVHHSASQCTAVYHSVSQCIASTAVQHSASQALGITVLASSSILYRLPILYRPGLSTGYTVRVPSVSQPPSPV